MLFRKKPGAADAAAFFAVLMAGLLLLYLPVRERQAQGGIVRVEVSGVTAAQFPLDVDRTEVIRGGGCTLTVCVSGGSVRVLSSDCPGGDCVKRGAVSAAGESIVCLPAGVVITVTGKSGEKPEGGGLDAVAG